jgi:putative tricarboxylic transport membrane protein
LWVKFLKIPYTILMTIVLAVMIVGAYTVSNTVFDVFVMLLFGGIGYVLRKLDFPLAPIVLTLIMGPPMEKSLRQSLEMSQGDFSILVASPISATLLAISAIILFTPMLKYAWKRWAPYSTAQGA